MKTWTIAKIKTAMKEDGSRWWNPATIRFFGSRVESPVYEGAGGIFFVTSEDPPRHQRKCTVRKFDPLTLKISTVGDYCQTDRVDAIEQTKAAAKGNDNE